MHKTHRRFRGYDYARGGSMFVTTCLEHRRPLFGRVDHKRVVRFKQMSHYHIAGRAPGIWEKGYTYLSTFFSPGERMVFKALAELENVPMIRQEGSHAVDD